MSDIPLRDDPTRPPFDGPRLLERAVVAVTFTPIAKIATDQNFVSAFQDRVRQKYPFFQRLVEPHVQIDLLQSGEIKQQQSENVTWQFTSADGHSTIALNQGLIAFDVQRDGYKSWPALSESVVHVLNDFFETMGPSHVVRIGVRYLNTGRAEGDQDPRLSCTKELVSISGMEGLRAADLLWHFDVKEGRMLLRSGMMPPNATYDPSFFAPRPQQTWYLDIDVMKDDLSDFSIKQISAALTEQAMRLHAVYQWAMTREGEEA